jgi:hypothetical protein
MTPRVGGACSPPPPVAAPLRCALLPAATPRMMGASRGYTGCGRTYAFCHNVVGPRAYALVGEASRGVYASMGEGLRVCALVGEGCWGHALVVRACGAYAFLV